MELRQNEYSLDVKSFRNNRFESVLSRQWIMYDCLYAKMPLHQFSFKILIAQAIRSFPPSEENLRVPFKYKSRAI